MVSCRGKFSPGLNIIPLCDNQIYIDEKRDILGILKEILYFVQDIPLTISFVQ